MLLGENDKNRYCHQYKTTSECQSTLLLTRETNITNEEHIFNMDRIFNNKSKF